MNAPFSPRLAAMRDPFCAFLSDADADHTARDTAAAMNWPLERIHDGGIRHAVQTLAVSASPAVLLVDLSDSADPMEDINALAEVCEPGTIVLTCGRINDVRFYRDLLATGVNDYLLKPFTQEHLTQSILQAQADAEGARSAEATDETPHMMTTVVGVRGGVGCSTIAVSIAWLLSEAKQRNTALLDLDVHFGTGALALDLEPGRGLTDAIENPSRIDGLFLERALIRVGERLGVLSAEAPIHQPLTGDGAAFFQLQDELRSGFSCTVLDLPRHMLVQHPMLMQGVAVTVVVSELTLAATRDTIRMLSWLRSNAPQTRIVLVLNKLPAGNQEEISRKDFETSVERKVDLVVPYDLKLASQSAKIGKPMAEAGKGSRAAQALGELADLIAGSDAGEDGGKPKRRRGGGIAVPGKSLAGRIGGLLPRKPAK